MLGAIAVGVLLHRVSDIVRGAPLLSVEGGGGTDVLKTSAPDFVERVGALSETTLRSGHEVELLIDDLVFTRMLAELATAQRSVTFLGYYCHRGVLGSRVGDVLAERARAGVHVLFLGDGFGCADLLDTLRVPLRAAGAQVASFRPLRWYSLHRAQHRMHARSVVIDGTVGYTGGFGIDDKWIQDHPGDPKWRDTGVRFTGPTVSQMQATFMAAWGEATGAFLTGEDFFPPPNPALAMPDTGGVIAGLLYSRPALGPTSAERHLALTLAAAERTLFLSNSYFVPTPLMRELLADAARSGVDVRVLVPGPRTDIPSTRYAGRGYYEELLASGVRVFEYQPAMMHAKTVVVDGVWSALGSVNLDNRSLRLNDESALLVHDSVIGARMDSIFLADLARAREITLPAHRQRPRRERLMELFSSLIAPLL